jgi:GNAT superfamily N-acetyltransferase
MLNKHRMEIPGVGPIEVVEVTDPESSLYKSVVKIYEDSFPASEKEKVRSIAHWLRIGEEIYPNKYHMLALVSLKEELRALGFGTFHFLAKINSAFLGYLAVEKDSRNRGLGSVLFAEIEDLLTIDAQANSKKPVLGIFTELEKENPADPETTERFRFWNKQNMKPLMLDWAYPPMYKRNEPANMYLAFCPHHNSPGRLTMKQAKEVCLAIYQSVYGCPDTDARLANVISSFKGRRWVPRFTVKAAS